jgi:cyclin H
VEHVTYLAHLCSISTIMIEDDIYRSSTQYRYWSYTREALASLRQSTNELASERVRAAFGRIRNASQSSKEQGSEHKPNEAHPETQQSANDVETLTVEEELKMVHWGCSKIIETGKVMSPPIPMEIRVSRQPILLCALYLMGFFSKATAIQFLRRFYLTNSPMTYNPKQILTCALFLATKTDHWHIPLSTFVDKIRRTEEEDVRAPEFLLMQGLRFTLDVRHPTRGLEGGTAEILKLLEEKRMRLDDPDAKTRVGKAANGASRLLRVAAQMTDVYFLFTPSQIWLSALMAVDPDLANEYLSSKMDHLGPAAATVRTKLELTLGACGEMLSNYKSEDDANEAEQEEMMKEMKRIGKKLHLCQDPEKMDIVAVTKQKREGSESDKERVLKKRKLGREKLQRDGDVFGPSLQSLNG